MVSFDWFPLFLHFLTFLIKLILQLKLFSTNKRKAEEMWEARTIMFCSVSQALEVRELSKEKNTEAETEEN